MGLAALAFLNWVHLKDVEDRGGLSVTPLPALGCPAASGRVRLVNVNSQTKLTQDAAHYAAPCGQCYVHDLI